MIFTPHIIIGAAIGTKTQNLGLIIILGIAIHFILDKIPHWDYPISENLRNFQKTKKIKYLIPPFLKASIDVLSGLLIVFLIIQQKNLFDILPFIILGIIFSLLPDIINSFIFVFAKDAFFEKYFSFHIKYLHCIEKKEGEITFFRIFSEVLTILIGIIIMIF